MNRSCQVSSAADSPPPSHSGSRRDPSPVYAADSDVAVGHGSPRVFLAHYRYKSMEENITRREFRDRPDSPLADGQQHHKISQNATERAELKRKVIRRDEIAWTPAQHQSFSQLLLPCWWQVMRQVEAYIAAGAMSAELVWSEPDNTLQDLWMTNLDKLYWHSRLYSPAGSWPSPY
jgi:hypothetical protein